MSTSVGLTNEEMIASYKQQILEHEKIRRGYHLKEPKTKNLLIFGGAGMALGLTTANVLLGIASHKNPGSTKGYAGIANLLSAAVSGLIGAWTGVGYGFLQQKLNSQKYNQLQEMYDKETKILEELNKKIEELEGKSVSYEM